jgi:hypothetical protein
MGGLGFSEPSERGRCKIANTALRPNVSGTRSYALTGSLRDRIYAQSVGR